MLKQFFILAILTPIVLSRSTIEEIASRQWEDSDLRQNCTQSCTDECTTCNDPDLCDEETEIKCGSTPQHHEIYELVVNCPHNEICVPKGCECT